VAADLPALVLRLKTLETVHRGAATFAARLQVRGDETSPVLSHFATRHSPRAQTGEGVDPCPPPVTPCFDSSFCCSRARLPFLVVALSATPSLTHTPSLAASCLPRLWLPCWWRCWCWQALEAMAAEATAELKSNDEVGTLHPSPPRARARSRPLSSPVPASPTSPLDPLVTIPRFLMRVCVFVAGAGVMQFAARAEGELDDGAGQRRRRGPAAGGRQWWRWWWWREGGELVQAPCVDDVRSEALLVELTGAFRTSITPRTFLSEIL